MQQMALTENAYYTHGQQAALYKLGFSRKQAGIAALPTKLIKNTVLKAKPTAGKAMPKSFGGSLNKGSAGMFDSVDSAAKAGKGFNPKTTMRGEKMPSELPPMRPLPTS